jgi:hypothetical protein
MTSVELPKSTRFHGWAALFVFSIVALGAHASALGGTCDTMQCSAMYATVRLLECHWSLPA